MGDFRNYLLLSDSTHALALLMVKRGVDPHAYITEYLKVKSHSSGRLDEGWLGGFFKRLSAAWNAFWNYSEYSPAPQGNKLTPEQRLENAKQAIEQLVTIYKNEGGNSQNVPSIIRGLEQSLNILSHIGGLVKDQEKAQVNPHKGKLPEDLQAKYDAIMHDYNTIMAKADNEEKAKELFANDDKLMAFRRGLDQIYQKMDPNDPGQKDHKEALGIFLRGIDRDEAFRKVQNIMDFGKKRMGKIQVGRPPGYEEAVLKWRQIAGGTPASAAQKQGMENWYQGLPVDNPVRKFIKQEADKLAASGTPESEGNLLWKYVRYWVNRFPSHFEQGQA